MQFHLSPRLDIVLEDFEGIFLPICLGLDLDHFAIDAESQDGLRDFIVLSDWSFERF